MAVSSFTPDQRTGQDGVPQLAPDSLAGQHFAGKSEHCGKPRIISAAAKMNVDLGKFPFGLNGRIRPRSSGPGYRDRTRNWSAHREGFSYGRLLLRVQDKKRPPYRASTRDHHIA